MKRPHAVATRSIWPKIPAGFTAAALAGHSAMGLAFGALIYLVCLTGAACVLIDELKLVEQPYPAAAALHPGALDRAAAEAMRRSPPGSTFYVMSPVTPRQRLTVSSFGAGPRRAWIADADGRLTPERTPWTDFLTDLHIDLTAPAPWGALVVGLAGAALLSLLISGVLSHPRLFRDAFRLRLSGAKRLREAELHNRLSVWGLPFHVVVTLTGAFYGLTAVLTLALAATHHGGATVYAPLSGPEPAVDARPAPVPDLEALATRARALQPGSQLYYIGLERPGTRGARYAVEVTAPGRLPRGEQLFYDADGRQIGRGRFATGSLGLQTYAAGVQLHFGFFGGLPVRLAYVVLGAALTYVSASGVTIWLARRRDQGRPAPRLERLWRGWTWGAPAALIGSALASRLLPPAPVFWTLAAAFPLAALAAPAFGVRPGRVRR